MSTNSWVSWEEEMVAEPVGALRALTPYQTLQHLPYPSTRLPSLILGQHLLNEPSGQILTMWLLVFPTYPQTCMRHLTLTRLRLIRECLQRQSSPFVQGYVARSDLRASLHHVLGGQWEHSDCPLPGRIPYAWPKSTQLCRTGQHIWKRKRGAFLS